MYSGGCNFVDHASGYVHNEFQAQMNTHQTLKPKETFEAHCQDVGIVRFAGTGAHHQNALAEQTIGTIMAISCTMLMHGATHWPDVIESSLWPMAVVHAIFIWNRMPNPTNELSPIDVFTHSCYEHRRFHDLHIWGCPRMCMSWTNGCQMARRFPPNGTLSLTTGLQQSPPPSLPNFNSPAWAELFEDSIFLSPYDEETDEQLETPPPRLAAEDTRQEAAVTAIEHLHPPHSLPVVPPPTVPQASSPTIPLPLATASPSSFERETSVEQRETSVEQRETSVTTSHLSHLNLRLRCRGRQHQK
eukprot:scaffold128481_cov35-Attheya_sp.AAC.1